MKKIISFELLSAVLAVFCLTMIAGFAQESIIPSDPVTAPVTESVVDAVAADSTAPDMSAVDPSCDPCADACGECYNGVGYGYGCGYGVGYGCGARVLSVVHGAAEIALTPVHWIAGLLSCGTYGDCGCAPLPCRTYRDPCDNCGNWVGGCDYCGGTGCSSCGTQMSAPAESMMPVEQALPNQTRINNNSDYLDFSKVETIGQRKARQMKAAASAVEEIPGAYIYTEEPVKGAQRPVIKSQTIASHPVARTAQRPASRPQPKRQVNTNGRLIQTNSANR